ncbi:MAG: DUF465 domain-containing protein [Gammaproteobacteria bacterium]|jgi:hypothetical protein|uniref:DUF465 domain-containing protein n=1 Tax=Limnobacter profundi TaxID=2732163 RepID=A0ABX6N8E2_9BURK|nr:MULTISPECIES: DUF465 domain-containing protein [unclassified Limnobacter]MAG80782.1 hypothetical protein [Sutterellaceae bacterium]MBA4315521.1 hypothetical protein [Alcaligenaceae bacterium]MBU0540946.1 DUF465 domain-containing protein [Gammaproteobacteria bacterium]PZO15391.1 MAG: hypothetical protein DCE87_08500 [Betaproteobacteria bacterium]MBT85262.1 hypothetical protein [Sutterellaceae bacterium]
MPMVHTEDIESIKRRIVELQVEHRDLDQIIAMLTAQTGFDQLQVRRLKKRKLQIKDSITLLQIQLEPDIPA